MMTPTCSGSFGTADDRFTSLVLHAFDKRAARRLYVHSDPLKRNLAYVRSIGFHSGVDLEAYSDPQWRQLPIEPRDKPTAKVAKLGQRD